MSADRSRLSDHVAPLALAEILARGVAVSWDEAVAVVEALCVVLQSQESESVVPGSASVFIESGGAVSVRPHAGGDRGPTAAGHLLHDLLTNSTAVPVALRLFVSQATASGTHGSLREFAAGLAYFGKPGGAELIRDLHHRAAAAATTPATDTRVPPPLNAQTLDRPKSSPPRAPRRRSPLRWVLAGAAVCAMLLATLTLPSDGGLVTLGKGAVGLWSWAKGAAAGIGEHIRVDADAAGAAASLEALDQAAPSPAKSVANRVRPALIEPPSAVVVAQTQAGSATGLVEVSNAGVLESHRLQHVPAPTSLFAMPVDDSARERERSGGPASAERPGTFVYSSKDTDVEPPVLLNPQLPRPLIVDSPLESFVNRMELIVASDGTVERVRLIDGPTRMPDMMLLSGAKLWKFAPASKDGQPVRYRAFVSWSGVP